MESELKFEKALERLEKIVEDLENGNMPLEDALKKYEEGAKLSRLCTEKLTQAESKIEILTRTLSGALSATKLGGEASALDSEEKGKKTGKKIKKRSETSEQSDEDLLA